MSPILLRVPWPLQPYYPFQILNLSCAMTGDDAQKITSEPHNPHTLETIPAQ